MERSDLGSNELYGFEFVVYCESIVSPLSGISLLIDGVAVDLREGTRTKSSQSRRDLRRAPNKYHR